MAQIINLSKTDENTKCYTIGLFRAGLQHRITLDVTAMKNVLKILWVITNIMLWNIYILNT